MRTLVADDDSVSAAMLAGTLERWGLEVVIARDGEEAWRVIQEDSRVSIAILDWMMPGADGPELCRRIRLDEAHAHMHVILLTSRDTHKDIVAGINAGADDYLVKPFDPDELRARVNVGIRMLTLQNRLAARVDELQAALSKVKQLSGLLPICCYCKRIRSDQDYWQQVETYISDHTDAMFSHGICPPCLAKAMAELDPPGPSPMLVNQEASN